MPLTAEELDDLIDEKILTGGRRTLAAGLRQVLHELVAAAFQSNIKNYEGDLNPTNAENLSQGYTKFSMGITTAGSVWICIASDSTSAAWRLIYGSGDEPGSGGPGLDTGALDSTFILE
jgi:hypothetical protein